MKKIRSLLIIFLLATFLLGCGEAGVQIRVGDDYETIFIIDNQAFDTVIDRSANTTIREDLREYGDFLDNVDVNRLEISFENYTGNTTGQIIVTLAGETFDTGPGVAINQNSTFTFTNTTSLASIASRIQQGDIGLDLDATTTGPLGDDNFEIIVTIEVLATVGEDPF